MKSFELALFADYFQFYIQDEAAKGDLSEAWSEEATDRLLAIAPGTIGIGTVRNMEVPIIGTIENGRARLALATMFGEDERYLSRAIRTVLGE